MAGITPDRMLAICREEGVPAPLMRELLAERPASVPLTEERVRAAAQAWAALTRRRVRLRRAS